MIRHFGYIFAIVLKFFVRDVNLVSNLFDRLKLAFAGDFEFGFIFIQYVLYELSAYDRVECDKSFWRRYKKTAALSTLSISS